MNYKLIIHLSTVSIFSVGLVSCEVMQKAAESAAPVFNQLNRNSGYSNGGFSQIWNGGGRSGDLAKILYVIQTVVKISEQQRAYAQRDASKASQNERLRVEAQKKGAKYYAIPVRRDGSNRGGYAKARVSDGKVVSSNLSVPKDGVSLSKGQVISLGGDKAYVTNSYSQGDM